MIVDISKILDKVQKPGRYIGGEHNSVVKRWDGDKVKFVLCYPDIYEVGMSNLGVKILYHLLNEKPYVLCERVFSPWPDMEAVLKEEHIPLFSLESKRPLSEFDLLGFSLSHEFTYTNALNALRLSNIPVLSKDRSLKDPLVIAGGQAVFNPEPLADFIDLFLIGEAEEAILEIIDAFKEIKKTPGMKREKILERMAEVRGVYVPSFNGGDAVITKRVVRDLNSCYYPTSMIVPFIEIVHDRIPLEIMRGCPYNCRFCQARNTYGPVRVREKETILKLATEALKSTGYDEVSLLSLSSNAHPQIYDIMDAFSNDFREKGIAMSVPSLRIEEGMTMLPQIIATARKTGLTFAPESASQRVRKILNKKIDMDHLFCVSRQAYKAGWRRVKLYFMIGLPGERTEDLCEMIRLGEAISRLRKEVGGGYADVTMSINAFIPKPHTPFQWEGMDSMKALLDKQSYMKGLTRSNKIKLRFHDARMSHVEALLSRGDRRLGRVIYSAWQKGAKFDSWKEFFNFDTWMDALKECDIDPDFYTTRKRPLDEKLPWDHIHAVDKSFLLTEAQAVR